MTDKLKDDLHSGFWLAAFITVFLCYILSGV